jgi:hypothetical protein
MTRFPARPIGIIQAAIWLIGGWLVGAAITVALLMLFGDHARAQTPPPRPHPASDPAAVALHERHVRVSGTATPPAFQHSIMEMRIGDGPLMRTESYVAQPGRILVRTTVGGAVAMEFGFDGTTGWSSSPQTGLIRLDSAGVDALRGSASFGTAPALDPSAKQRAIGRSTFDDQLVDGVRVVLATGDSADIFYAVSTGLMAGMQLRSTESPAANMTIMLRDYKRVGGRLEHTTSVFRGGTMEMVARTVHVDHEPIDAAKFTPPAP